MSAQRKSRIDLRPRPEDWSDDDPMTLEEAVAVFWPVGPLTVSSLRTEIRNGRLNPARVAGKFYVTPAQLRALFAPCPAAPKAPACISAPTGKTGKADRSPTSGSSETAPMSAARAAALTAVRMLSEGSLNTSPKSTPPRNAQVIRLPS